jgi:hypothetical protein
LNIKAIMKMKIAHQLRAGESGGRGASVAADAIDLSRPILRPEDARWCAGPQGGICNWR